MYVRVLGPLEVRDGNQQPLSPGGERQRRLLAMLVAHRGQVVTVDSLADAVWDEPPPDPAQAVQTVVSRLRRRLGGETIGTRPPGYVFTGTNVDAVGFEQLLARARTLEDPSEALGHLDEALALWAGPAYAGFADEPWARPEATRLEELRADAMEERATRLIHLHRSSDAITTLESLVASHPFRERPRAQLMTALHRAGRKPEALAVYRDFRKLLADELGLEPSRELQVLERELLRDEPAAVDPGPTATVPGTTWFTSGRLEPRISYVEIEPGVRIAWAQFGSGPRLFMPPNWVARIDMIAAGEDIRSGLVHRLARDFTLVTYDRLGTGLSHSDHVDASLEHSVRELLAVAAAVTDEPMPALALSASGPIVVEAAATEPERFSHLVLFGTFASGKETFQPPEAIESVRTIVRHHWGMGSLVMANLLIPGASSEDAENFARFQRKGASAAVAAAFLDQMFAADVSGRLAEVTTPALVLHYRQDRAIPFRGAEQLAAGLPKAQLVPLEGRLHLPPIEQHDHVVELIHGFLSAR